MNTSVRRGFLLLVGAFLGSCQEQAPTGTSETGGTVSVVPRLLAPSGGAGLPKTDSVHVRLETADSRVWDSVWSWDKDSAWFRGVGRSSRYRLDVEGFSGRGEDRVVRWQGWDTARLLDDHQRTLSIGVGIVLRDSTVPAGVLSAKTPETDEIPYGQDSFVVEWTVQDDSLAWVRIGDTTWLNPAPGLFRRRITVVPGTEAVIQLRAQDRAGNHLDRTVRRSVPATDTVAPKITWVGSGLQSGRFESLADSFPLAWMVDDAWIDRIELDGKRLLPDGGGVYRDTARGLVRGGMVSLTLSARDLEGHVSTLPLILYRVAPDSLAPSLAFDSLVSGRLRLRSDRGTLWIRASDDSGLARVACGDQTLLERDGRYPYSFEGLPEGLTEIECLAVDLHGRQTRKTIGLWRIDAARPLVQPQFAAVQDTLRVVADTVTLRFDVSDENGLAKVMLGGQEVLAPFSLRVQDLAWNHPRAVVCHAWNVLGNDDSVGVVVVRIPVDSAAPILSMGEATGRISLLTASVDTSLSLSALDDSAVVGVRCADQELRRTGGRWDLQLHRIGFSWDSIDCVARDGAGHVDSLSVAYRRKDLVAPRLEFRNTLLFDTLLVATDTATLLWTVSDSTKTNVTIDRAAASGVNGVWSHRFTGLKWGEVRRVEIVARDIDGNTDSVEVRVRRLALDSLAPNLRLSAGRGPLADSMVIGRADTLLRIVATDDSLVAGVDCGSGNLSFDGQGWVWAVSSVPLSWRSTSCTVRDASGKSTVRPLYVRRKDGNPPRITLRSASVLDTILAMSDTVTVSWSVFDSLAPVKVRLDSQVRAPSITDTIWRVRLDKIEWGAAVRHVIDAIDADGNPSSKVFWVRRPVRDTLGPVVRFLGLTNGVLHLDSVGQSFQVVVHDDSSGVASLLNADPLEASLFTAKNRNDSTWELVCSSGCHVGASVFFLRATDRLGRMAVYQLDVDYKDTVAPGGTWDGGTDTVRTTADTVTLSFHYTDQDPSLEYRAVWMGESLDGSRSWVISDTSRTWGAVRARLSNLDWGTIRVKLVLLDPSGNDTTFKRLVKRSDLELPTVTWVKPPKTSDSLFPATDTLTLRVQAFDNSAVTSVSIGGVPANLVSGVWSARVGGLVPGLATAVRCEATDRFGNVGSLDVPVRRRARRGSSIEVLGGTFEMGGGSSSDWPSLPVAPIHQVTLHPFWMDTTEFTELGANQIGFGTSTSALPVICSWYDAIRMCNARSRAENLDTVYRYSSITFDSNYIPVKVVGLADIVADRSKNGYRLPTESEWTFVAVADSQAARPIAELGWVASNSGLELHDVATKPANPWGFHDLFGNASEWVWDLNGTYPAGPVTDPDGPDPASASERTGMYRILRGGDAFRASYEYMYGPHFREEASPGWDIRTGFRMVRGN